MTGERLEDIFGKDARREVVTRCAYCDEPFREGDVALYWPDRKEYFCDTFCLARWLLDTGIVEEVEVQAQNRPDPMQRRDQ